MNRPPRTVTISISVLFATHNGAKTLPRMLDALCLIDWPSNAWEVIAVDNGSQDDTRAILDGYRSRLPLRVVDCPERGKNRALNRGLEHVTGELTILTDDDILPEPDWLRRMADGATAHPEFAIFGGRILPEWPSDPPGWILENVPLGMTFALTEGDPPGGEVDPGLVWGPNMMCRTAIFEAGHRFDERIGPAAGNYVMGSETEFTRRMVACGFRCAYLPESRVRHIVRANQFEPDWLLNRSLRAGKASFVHNNARHLRQARGLLGIPRWMLRNAIRDLGRFVMAALRRDRTQAFRAQWQLYRFAGYARQALAAKRQEHAPSVRAGSSG